jgi:predicted nucleic acid-binding protein
LRTIVLDAGAFIAAERRDKHLTAFVRAAEDEGSRIVVPALVIAEIWREPPSPLAAGLLKAVNFVAALDDRDAKGIGALLGSKKKHGLVDAGVALVAMRYMPSLVLTSDIRDIVALVSAAGGRCALGSAASSTRADVIVQRI